MQISPYMNTVSVFDQANRVQKPQKEQVLDQEKTPVGVYFDSWDQRDKDIFDKLTENMSPLDKGSQMIWLWFHASTLAGNNEQITADQVSVEDMLKSALKTLKNNSLGQNTEETVSLIEDFIKLRESGYSPINRLA